MTETLEANPPEETLPAVLCGHIGLVNMLWCARDGATDDDVIAAANDMQPLGGVGTGSWELSTDQPTVRCPDYTNRRHIVVNC